MPATRRLLTTACLLLGGVVGPVACSTPPLPAADPATRHAAPSPTPAPVPTTTAPAVTGPTVQQLADALGAISPLRHPRDNTGSCSAAAGCLGLITAGTVSIYQWPDVSSAQRYAGKGGADRIGAYVLSYRSKEQQSTPPDVRQAYLDKVRTLVGPTP